MHFKQKLQHAGASIMPLTTVTDVQRRDESRSNRFAYRFTEPMLEGNSADGLPEFSDFPTVRSRFVRAPQTLKKEPASKAHIFALAKVVFDAVSNLSAEMDKLKKSRVRP
jgi:hypothetical protein